MLRSLDNVTSAADDTQRFTTGAYEGASMAYRHDHVWSSKLLAPSVYCSPMI